MGHSDIGGAMSTYTYLGLEDAKEEMIRMGGGTERCEGGTKQDHR